MHIDEINYNQAKVYLQWFAGVLIGGAVISLIFVSGADPYNLYGWFKYKGINNVKPQPARYLEEIKLTQALKFKPDFIILGNSRAEIGFDPESPVFLEHGYSAYNLAIRGTSIEVSHRQLDFLLANGIKPKKILIALDFLDFINTSLTANNRSKSINETIDDFPVDQWFWRFDSLFSMTSFKDAFRTLVIQTDINAPTMTKRGFNPLREYLDIARNEGYFVMFQQKAEGYVKNFSRKSLGNLDRTGFLHLQAILKIATNSGSEVVVIIYPYHAQILALFEETGLTSKFSEWKRELVTEVESFKYKEIKSKIKLIDFSGYSSYQCEKIPGKGDLRTIVSWYWEAGHFKQVLGDIVLKRSLDLLNNSSATFANGFGVDLSKASIDYNTERMRKEKEQCLNIYPQLFEDAKILAQNLSSKN